MDALNSKASKTTFVLDIDHRHSPVYVAGLNEPNPGSVMEAPKTFAIPGMYQKNAPFHCESFRFIERGAEENKVLIVPAELESQAEVSALGRHFMIPFPGTFLESTSLTRAGIQKTNPYAVKVLKFLETLEFLFSSEGIRLCWIGTLQGQKLPESEWVRRENSAGVELPIKECDKVAASHKTKLYTRDTDGRVAHFFTGLIEQDDPRLDVDPDSIQMRIQPVSEGEAIIVDKVQLWWDFVPLVEPDFGFDQETRDSFNESLMFDKDSDIGCINMHFKINDPRIDPRSGFKNLWEQALMCRKKNKVEASKELEDMALTPEEYNALRYAISPRSFIEAISIITSSPKLAQRSDLEDPGVSIWGAGPGSFDICSILAVIPPTPDKEAIWNTTFSYPAYATGSNNGHVEDIFKERLQGRVSEFILPFIYESDDPDVTDISENQWIFCFPVPARVCRIPSSRIHPMILSNCLIPCFTTSARHVRHLPHKEYDPAFDKKLQRVMIPEVTDIGLMELAGGVDALRMKNWRAVREPTQTSFLVDQIRLEKFGATPMQHHVKYLMQPGKATPYQLIQAALERLANDFESENPCAPSAQRAIFNWTKVQRKTNENFSLFPDVYNDEMGFEFFNDLSVASNFKANILNLLDNLYCVYQNHRYVLHVCTLLFLSTKMMFGDKLFTLFTGPPEVSKSFIFSLVYNCFAIPGTMREEGSQTTQSVNSGASDPGMMIYHDDMSASTSPIFTATHKESDADAAMKAAMSNSCTWRVSVFVDKGIRRRELIFTDHRGTEAGNTNSSKYNMVPSFLSRTMIQECGKSARGMEPSQLDLKKGAYYNSSTADQVASKFQLMMKSQQAFICIILQAIRAGALPFDNEKNEEFAKNIHNRFKDSLKSILGSESVTLSLRMENGQLIPIMMGKMLERIYAACVSGVFNSDEGSFLSVGAKFDFKGMLNEINSRTLLQFDVSDYIEAISFFNGSLSQETTQVLVKAIRKKIRTKTSANSRPNSGIVFGETPMNGVVDESQPFHSAHLPVHSWLNHSSIFFNECQQNNCYAINYNWIDLSELFGLNALTGSFLQPRQILRTLAGALQDVIGASFDFMLVMQELGHWQEGLTNQKVVTEVSRLNQQVPILQESEIDYEVDQNIMKLQYQVPANGRAASWHILLSSKWLEEKAKRIRTGGAVPPSPASNKFSSSVVELALQCLPFSHCYKSTYLLPGMTFDRPAMPGNFAMPHIAKTLRMCDATKDGEVMKEIAKRGMKPLLFVALNKADGKRLGYTGGGHLAIPRSYDYYSTCLHFLIVRDKFKNLGVYDESSQTFVREEELTSNLYVKWMQSDKYTKCCPAGIETIFDNIRNEHCKRINTAPRDYVDSMIQTEEQWTLASQKKQLHPTTAFQLLGLHHIQEEHQMETEFDTSEEDRDISMTPSIPETDTNERGRAHNSYSYDEEGEEEDNPERIKPSRPSTAWEKVQLAKQMVASREEENRRIIYPPCNESEPDEDDIVFSEQESYNDLDERSSKRRRHTSLIEEGADEEQFE